LNKANRNTHTQKCEGKTAENTRGWEKAHAGLTQMKEKKKREGEVKEEEE